MLGVEHTVIEAVDLDGVEESRRWWSRSVQPGAAGTVQSLRTTCALVRVLQTGGLQCSLQPGDEFHAGRPKERRASSHWVRYEIGGG